MSAKRGRPPKGPISGKSSVLSARITREMKTHLEEESERSGRSISQIAEIWLEEGRFFSELKRKLFQL